MSSAKGYLAIVSALVFCPCHLPILAAVLAGTALGSAITDNFGLLFPLTALYFIGALTFGVRWMTREKAPACEPCESPARSHSGEQESRDARIPVANEPGSNGTQAREPVEGRQWR